MADVTSAEARQPFALVSLASLGVDTASIPPPAIIRTFMPRQGWHTRYREALERQARLYALLADWGRQAG
jgi:hypothetical protein